MKNLFPEIERNSENVVYNPTLDEATISVIKTNKLILWAILVLKLKNNYGVMINNTVYEDFIKEVTKCQERYDGNVGELFTILSNHTQ